MVKKRKLNNKATGSGAESSGRSSPEPEARIQPPLRPLLRRLFHWGPLLALSVIGHISISSIYCHAMWWPPAESLGGIIHFTIFMLWIMLTTTNLFYAAYVGPGYVPLGWTPSNKSDESKLQYCLQCESFKSPRSHHCRKCNRCVIKMDHHCPWINNCCGHRNQGAFTKFLIFAVMGCIQGTVILGSSVYRAIFRIWYLVYGTGTEPIVHLELYGLLAAILGFGFAVGVILAVGFLFIVQMRSILRNSTGIEDYIRNKAECRDRDDEFIFPYDLGWWNNFTQVITLSGEPKGDGIWWPIVNGCDQFTLSIEQLDQKEEKRLRAKPYIITRSYSGRICTCWHGPFVLCCQPYTEETRIALKPGQHFMITRGMKYWLYGELMYDPDEGEVTINEKSDQKFQKRRGWFPRCCSRKLTDVTILNENGNHKKAE